MHYESGRFPLRKLNIAISIVIVFFSLLPAYAVLMSDSGHALFSSFGGMSAGISADWISISLSEEETNSAAKSTDEIEVLNGYFYNVTQSITFRTLL